jgi:hypothetical protein
MNQTSVFERRFVRHERGVFWSFLLSCVHQRFIRIQSGHRLSSVIDSKRPDWPISGTCAQNLKSYLGEIRSPAESGGGSSAIMRSSTYFKLPRFSLGAYSGSNPDNIARKPSRIRCFRKFSTLSSNLIAVRCWSKFGTAPLRLWGTTRLSLIILILFQVLYPLASTFGG